MRLEAVELSKAEPPRAAVHAVAAGRDVGAKVAAADTLGVEERHDCLRRRCDLLQFVYSQHSVACKFGKLSRFALERPRRPMTMVGMSAGGGRADLTG